MRKQWYKQRKNAAGETVNKTIMANETEANAKEVKATLEKDGWSDTRPKGWVDPVGALGGETQDLAIALAKVNELEAKVTNMQEAIPLSKRSLVDQVAQLTAMVEKEAQVNEELVAKIQELTESAPDASDDGEGAE